MNAVIIIGELMKTRILLLFISMAVLAVPSYAQFYQEEPVTRDDGGGGGSSWYAETSYRKGEYMDNPCTPTQEWIWVDYSAFVVGEQEEAGFDRYLFSETTSVGGSLTASGTSEADVAYGGIFAVRKYHKVNTADNFHVVTVINFNPASQYTWVTLETACGNGMPDSAQ
jgi:hypothetical protein